MAKNAATVPRVVETTFLILAYDGEDSAAIRDTALEGHLDFVERNCERYLACGPLRNPGETELIGSFFLLTADSEDAAREFLMGDPYMQSDMYETVTVHEATAAGGRWMGGVIWESAEAVRASAS